MKISFVRPLLTFDVLSPLTEVTGVRTPFSIQVGDPYVTGGQGGGSPFGGIHHATTVLPPTLLPSATPLTSGPRGDGPAGSRLPARSAKQQLTKTNKEQR